MIEFHEFILFSFVEKKCSTPLNPCNGKLTCSDPGYEYQSVCHPTCNKGYETDTTKYITCDINGWSGQIDDCQGNFMFLRKQFQKTKHRVIEKCLHVFWLNAKCMTVSLNHSQCFDTYKV